jgi:hypothetical protein
MCCATHVFRMKKSSLKTKAIQAIQKRGALLVYPLNNRKEPLSIWSELYPRTRMRWEWDADGDNRVAALWILREELSRSHQVVYVKWFQGRATFFSREVFVHLLAYLRAPEMVRALGPESQNILDFLLNDSPMSTKQVKAAAELEGRLNEPTYNRAMKPLWQYLLLVGFGEFDDSSFPSLGIGATQTLFEELWTEANTLVASEAEAWLDKFWDVDNPFYKFAKKLRKQSVLDKESADTYI